MRRIALTLTLLTVLGVSQAQRLTTTGWPFEPLPSAEAQAQSPALRAYAEALTTWLEANPSVSLELVEFAIWDQSALLTGIVGGSAPSFFNGNVLGGWNDGAIRVAFTQGLAADVTDQLERFALNERVADYAQPLWQRWEQEGRYYALPFEYVAGLGVYYRKDIFAELGVAEPEPGWTWDDFRALALELTDPNQNRRGAVLQSWVLNQELNANGFEWLTVLPNPQGSWPWRWDFTTDAARWQESIAAWRQTIHQDNSVIAQASGLGDAEVAQAFHRGDAAMMVNTTEWFTRNPASEEGMASLADRLGRPVEEVVGWVPMPRGELDTLSTTQPLISFIALNPDMSPAELDAAVSLYDSMVFGEGWLTQKQAAWAESEDLRVVYRDVFPVNGQTEIPGVPGTPADAWGEDFVANVEIALATPLVPRTDSYLPPQEETGPPLTALTDALGVLFFSEGAVDVTAELAQAEAIINQQAQSFASTLPEDTFVTGARAYYEALDAFWAEHAPEFHAQRVAPWLSGVLSSLESE